MPHPGNLAGKKPLGLKGPKEPKPPRKPIKTKPRRTTREKKDPAYLEAVADLPCVICNDWPVQVHHPCCGRYSQAKAPDQDAIPLCWNHHLGPDGVHTRKKWWIEQFGPDTDYIAPTRAKIESKDA